jgi:hypothetical protein
MPKRKTGPGHRIIQQRDHRCRRQAMLAAEMEHSADKTVTAVPVIVPAARPAVAVGKKREHEIEQLHGFCDFRFRHWSERSRPCVMEQPITGCRSPHSAFTQLKTTGSTKLESLFLSLPTRGLTGQAIISSEG